MRFKRLWIVYDHEGRELSTHCTYERARESLLKVGGHKIGSVKCEVKHVRRNV